MKTLFVAKVSLKVQMKTEYALESSGYYNMKCLIRTSNEENHKMGCKYNNCAMTRNSPISFARVLLSGIDRTGYGTRRARDYSRIEL
jgi:hypothetical protein